MQSIPDGNLNEIERGKQEMQAFTDEKPVWPNLTLSGEDIHRAFCVVLPDDSCSWSEMPEIAKMQYDDMAKELNRELDARQAWSNLEDKEISAVRCPRCGGMFTNFKLKEHPCL